MRDLRKHASLEYNELYIEEQNQLNENGILLADSKNRQKRKKRQKKKETGKPEENEQAVAEVSPSSPDPENYNQDNAQFGAAPSASQKDKKNQPQKIEDAGTQTAVQQPTTKNKKKRKKKKKEETLTNEQMNNLDIDELMEFINNKSQKKDESSKPQGSQKRVSSNTKACS